MMALWLDRGLAAVLVAAGLWLELASAPVPVVAEVQAPEAGMLSPE